MKDNFEKLLVRDFLLAVSMSLTSLGMTLLTANDFTRGMALTLTGTVIFLVRVYLKNSHYLNNK